MANVRGRLGRLERRVPLPATPHLYVAFVDGEGLILDDRSEAARPWVGRHYRELPLPVSVIGGVDPRWSSATSRAPKGRAKMESSTMAGRRWHMRLAGTAQRLLDRAYARWPGEEAEAARAFYGPTEWKAAEGTPLQAVLSRLPPGLGEAVRRELGAALTPEGRDT